MPKSADIDGTSFASVLSGKQKQSRDYILSFEGFVRAIRDQHWYLDGHGGLWQDNGSGDIDQYTFMMKKEGKDKKSKLVPADDEAQAAYDRLTRYSEKYPLPALDTPWAKRAKKDWRTNKQFNQHGVLAKPKKIKYDTNWQQDKRRLLE